MKSSATPRFWEAFQALPSQVQDAARKQHLLWRNNPSHPSLRFKKAGPFWTVRITDDYRTLALVRDGVYYWFWIGTHADYERILRRPLR